MGSTNFSVQLKNSPNLDCLATTSAGLPPAFAMPPGVPFPQNAALASQLAGAAILGNKTSFLPPFNNKIFLKVRL